MLKRLFFSLIISMIVAGISYAGPLGTDGNKSLASTSHQINTWSNNNKITVTWTKPGDDTTFGSVVGYSTVWDTKSNTMPEATITLESNATTTTSNALSDSQSIYFHIRVIYSDGSPIVADHLGPFYIDATAPSAPGSFTITKGDGKLTLNWTNPGDLDFAGVVIRRDTSGYPASATTGTAVATVTSTQYAAGASASYTDTGLTNGTAYYYSLFAYDQRGAESTRNYSSVAQANSKPESSGGSSAPPTVSSTNPAKDATGVPINANINVVFDKDMNSASFTTTTFSVKDASGNAINGSVSYTSATKTAKFTPSSNLTAGKTYTATILSGASGVKDSQGNGLDGNGNGKAEDAPTDNYAFNFTTTAPPKVTSTTPADGASVSISSSNTSIVIAFSKAMNTSTISTTNIIVKDASGSVIAGSVSYNTTDNTATFTTTSPISKPTTVTVTIKGGTSGITDADGVQLDSNGDGKLDGSDGDKTFSFMVQSTFNFDLSFSSGWNLISFPLELTNSAIGTALNGIAGKYLIVWEFTPPSTWKSYDPSDPEYSDLQNFTAGKGYWIKMKENKNISVTGKAISQNINLGSGWNLIGYIKTHSMTVGTALNGIAGKYQIVWEFTPPSTWKSYDPSDPEYSDLQNFTAGKGYWIKMKEAASLTLP
ncbi:MAG TPA: Ig-like domain-containing protein [Syntrophorhabdaceae bacterium]|nr:Ig-like domain-containing protein [Syntrophorhabdaceae bacterium]